MKKKVDLTLFERALEWYGGRDMSKKEAAKELFPESELKSALEDHNKQKEKKDRENRDIELREKLERCKKMFPLGTLIYSDDGTNTCPNVVVSEPYIGTSIYHRYYGGDYWLNYPDDQRTVLIDTMRIGMDGPYWKYGKSVVGLENILRSMDLPDSNTFKRNHIVDLHEFYKKEDERRQKAIEACNKRIKVYQYEVDRAKEEKAEYENYNPRFITEEYAKEVLEEYKKRKK